MKKYTDFLILFGIFFITLMVMTKGRTVEKPDYSPLLDTIDSYKRKDSSHVATIKALVFTNQNLLDEVKTQDTLIQKLKKELKNKSKVKSGTSFETVTVFKFDTTELSKLNFRREWFSIAPVDGTYFKVSVKNLYTVLVYDKKVNFFKREPYADVIAYNPYTEVKSVRAVIKEYPKPKRFGIGASLGYAIADKGLNPYIGIGVNYNLIEF